VASASEVENTATDKAAAVDRWEAEGGPQLPCGGEIRALGESDRHILECLGAAVVSGWNGLPTTIQRVIFKHAVARQAYDTAQLRAQVARFLHDHKNSGIP
jgi:hypothetical protein